MLKIPIKYKDFNEEDIEEDFYFNLNRLELIELELTHEGGLKASMEKIIASKDTKKIYDEFLNIIRMSYGERSLDGKKFRKSPEILDDFLSTDAPSELIFTFFDDEQNAANFIEGIMPKNLEAQVARITGEKGTPEVEMVTRAEVNTMSQGDKAELAERVNAGTAKIVEDITPKE